MASPPLFSFQGYEIHMQDSAKNISAYLGNTTDTFFKISNLKLGHNYTFTVQARCLVGSQLCGEPAVLLYELGSSKWSGNQGAEMAEGFVC